MHKIYNKTATELHVLCFFSLFGEGWRGVNEVLSVSDMIVWVVPYYGIELLFFLHLHCSIVIFRIIQVKSLPPFASASALKCPCQPMLTGLFSILRFVLLLSKSAFYKLGIVWEV